MLPTNLFRRIQALGENEIQVIHFLVASSLLHRVPFSFISLIPIAFPSLSESSRLLNSTLPPPLREGLQRKAHSPEA